MNEPRTAWDRPPTDKELDKFYGKDKGHEVRDLIVKTITETVRTVDYKVLSVPYVKYSAFGACVSQEKIAPYPLDEVVSDYGTEPKCMDALMTMFAKSDCPLVAAWRMAVAERFADCHADDVEDFGNE
jgi:hypothetical protein